MPRLRPLLFGLAALLVLPATAQERLTVAAAANLAYVLDPLHEAFQRSVPGVELTVSLGASGSLVAQIKHGAPYDVFLSADLDFPRALVKDGLAAESSLQVFAIGRLVLWTTRPHLELASIAETVQAPGVRRLAIAQPEHAPYGRAAQASLQHLGLWETLQPKLVIGENITQTAQFVETGHADAGFVALSLLHTPTLRQRGRWLEVPATWYPPLEQGVILTRRGERNPAAPRYVAFLQSPPARRLLADFGYQLPPLPPAAAPPR